MMNKKLRKEDFFDAEGRVLAYAYSHIEFPFNWGFVDLPYGLGKSSLHCSFWCIIHSFLNTGVYSDYTSNKILGDLNDKMPMFKIKMQRLFLTLNND